MPIVYLHLSPDLWQLHQIDQHKYPEELLEQSVGVGPVFSAHSYRELKLIATVIQVAREDDSASRHDL